MVVVVFFVFVFLWGFLWGFFGLGVLLFFLLGGVGVVGRFWVFLGKCGFLWLVGWLVEFLLFTPFFRVFFVVVVIAIPLQRLN